MNILNSNTLCSENILNLKEAYNIKKRVIIKDFLNNQFSESLFKHVFFEKNWILATGIDKNKYEKADNQQNSKINQLQIKNVQSAFGNDQFSYNFYRSMNGSSKMSYFEFTIRNLLSSNDFLNYLNNITGLNLTKLTTLFLSKYKAGSFLSPHSDKGNGRLAFVLNLSKIWKPQYGGVLHFMNDERTEIIDSYVPLFNSFMIFEVPFEKGIPHFVSHVSSNVKFNRYAITGWFD
jgi:Rps23 Pro-64 3,4-dihydroxylase Tpa1-like proline 4-hydroxylase